MSWMDSWSRPSKSQATPPPLYLTSTPNNPVPYCHSCGRVISQRRTQTSKVKTQEVKYCSARCRNSKPGPIDRKIETVFAALLDGAFPESLKEKYGQDGDGPEERTIKEKDDATGGRKEKEHGKGKAKKGEKKKAMKGDPRVIVECATVEAIVFQHEKDPEKVFGRRRNRGPRGIIEKPEDWRSVDMVDGPTPKPTPSSATTILRTALPKDSVHSISASSSSDLSASEGEEAAVEGGVHLDGAQAEGPLPDTIPLYGFGSGKVRPPQFQSDINGSIGGEKGWAERIEETDDMKAKRREGQRRADERETVRRAARRLVAFGVIRTGEGDEEQRKCEAVMKGAVVEASFAKGEWGVRWREKG